MPEMLDWEREQAIENTEVYRLQMERRFSPPGCCPFGCDGSGWEELEPGDEPGALDEFYNGQWWTPCGCNIGSTHWRGQRYLWVNHHLPGYEESASCQTPSP